MSFGISLPLGIPAVPQGQLNRVITNVVVNGFTKLSVTAQFMSKSQAQISFDEPAVDQIGTATGIINSPKPYIMGKLTINLLRTLPIGGLYLAQKQSNAVLGTVTAYPDVSGGVFPPISIQNAAILDVDPGAYDGQDPTVKVTISGAFPTNAVLWASA